MSAALSAFVAACRPSRPDVADSVDADAIEAVIGAGRSSASGIEVDEVAFATALGNLVAAGVNLDAVKADELWLAVGCAEGNASALTQFERRYLSDIGRHISHMGLDHATVSDVAQTTRNRLLLSKDGGPPRILGYAGRGQLDALVRVVATRAGLDARRSERRRGEVGIGGLTEVLMASADPEDLAAITRKHEVFREAFEAAIAALSASERTIMRLYAVDGVGIDGVAAAYGVHRSTAARRLAKVRQQIGASTQDYLRNKGVTETELNSIIAVVDEGLELTLSRILADPDPGKTSESAETSPGND